MTSGKITDILLLASLLDDGNFQEMPNVLFGQGLDANKEESNVRI